MFDLSAEAACAILPWRRWSQNGTGLRLLKLDFVVAVSGRMGHWDKVCETYAAFHVGVRNRVSCM